MITKSGPEPVSPKSPYYRLGKPFKNLKLLNCNQPAVSLSFYYKHKYSTQRTPAHDEVILHLRNSRDELLNRSLFKQLSVGQNEQLRLTDQSLRTLQDDP